MKKVENHWSELEIDAAYNLYFWLSHVVWLFGWKLNFLDLLMA